MTLSIKKIISSLIFISALLYFSSSYICITFSWGKYVIIIAIILCLFFYSMLNNWKIDINIGSFNLHLFSIVFFCAFSCIWAWDISAAFSKSVTLAEISICMCILYLCLSNLENGDVWLAKIIVLSGYTECVFLIIHFGIGSVLNFSVRMSGDVGNANYIGMMMAMSIITTVYFVLFDKPKWYYIFSIVNVYFLAISQSRTALLGMAIGVIVLLYFKCIENRNVLIRIIRIFIYFGVFILAVYLLSKTSLFEGMNARIHNLLVSFTGQGEILNGEKSISIRESMIAAGIEQFKSTPLLGIGIGNGFNVAISAVGHDTYLHNNYVELLVGIGIIGCLIYYSIYVHIIKQLFSLRKARGGLFYLVVALIIAQLLMDYGTVSYYTKDTYFYLMLYYIALKNIRLKNESYEIARI